MKEQTFSIGREERSLILIANFTDGYTSDFKFSLPESFREALDIKITPRMVFGKNRNVYTQGRNFAFKEGDVIYNTKKAYQLVWGEALKEIELSLQILKANDASTEIKEKYESQNPSITFTLKKNNEEKVVEIDRIIVNKYVYNPGYVKFQVFKPDEKKVGLTKIAIYECTQENFVVLLQTGILRTLDEQIINLL